MPKQDFLLYSAAQQITLRELYDGCNPRPMVDLVQGGGPALKPAQWHSVHPGTLTRGSRGDHLRCGMRYFMVKSSGPASPFLLRTLAVSSCDNLVNRAVGDMTK